MAITAPPRDGTRTLFAYILVGPGRPDRADQRHAAMHAGVDLGRDVFEDRPGARPTRPRSALAGRGRLLAALKPGDTVFVAAPLCLGLSGADAGWFLSRIRSVPAAIDILDGIVRADGPGSGDALLAEIERARKAAYIRAYRARRRSGD